VQLPVVVEVRILHGGVYNATLYVHNATLGDGKRSSAVQALRLRGGGQNARYSGYGESENERFHGIFDFLTGERLKSRQKVSIAFFYYLTLPD
jgi:hypothetical protein